MSLLTCEMAEKRSEAHIDYKSLTNHAEVLSDYETSTYNADWDSDGWSTEATTGKNHSSRGDEFIGAQCRRACENCKKARAKVRHNLFHVTMVFIDLRR